MIPFERSDIEDILSVARDRNKANEITGMLLYQGGEHPAISGRREGRSRKLL